MPEILTVPAKEIEPGDSLGEGLLAERVAICVDGDGDGLVYVFFKGLPREKSHVYLSHRVPVTLMRP